MDKIYGVNEFKIVKIPRILSSLSICLMLAFDNVSNIIVQKSKWLYSTKPFLSILVALFCIDSVTDASLPPQ